jgi:hypothetical protein
MGIQTSVAVRAEEVLEAQVVTVMVAWRESVATQC